MDNNKSIKEKIWDYVQKSVLSSKEDTALWNSEEKEDEDARNVLKARKYKEAVEAEGVLSNEDIIKLTKLLLKAFIDCDKEQRYEKAAEYGTSNILSPKERKKCEEQATETAKNPFRKLVRDQFNEELRSNLKKEVLNLNKYANLSKKEIKDKETEINNKVKEKFDNQWNTKKEELNKQIEIQLEEQLTKNIDKKKQFEEEKQKLFEQFYLESLESQNITSLIKCYKSESAGDGSCGYVSIAKACGQKKNSGTEYARFFDVLKKFKEAIDDGIKLGKVDKWEEQFRIRKWSGSALSDDGVLITALLDVIQRKDVKVVHNQYSALGVLAELSSYIIKNWEMIKTVIDPENEINLDQNALSKAKEQNLITQEDKLNVAKDLLTGMEGLAKDYSALLKKNYPNCETAEGKGNLNEIDKLPFANFIYTIQKFYPVTINKYDIGEDYDTMRYVYRQAFMGYGLNVDMKEGEHIRSLGWDSIQELIKGDIEPLPQSDDELNQDIKIKCQNQNYKVQYKKSEFCMPEWLEFEYLIGLSKKINKPVFCLSSNPKCVGLFVFDASKINEQGNDEHLCRFRFSMSDKLDDKKEFNDKKIKYYSELADEYNNALKNKNNPVLFFSSNGQSGHYTYLDPEDQVLRENFARDIKRTFFDRYIEENMKRQRCQTIIFQANKIRELRDQINGLNAEQAKKLLALNEQNAREQKLNEKEKILSEKEANLKEKQNSLEKNENDLKLKENELNNKEQNIKVRENELQAEKKNLANKEKGIKERESLQNELTSLKKNNEERVSELNSEVQNLQNKNKEQEKQILILKSKNNDQKLAQMQERIEEITADNEKKVNTLESKVKDLKNKNNEQETELTKNKNLLNGKNEELKKMTEKAKELESQLKTVESQKADNETKVKELDLKVKNLQNENKQQKGQISILNSKNNDTKLNQMTKKVDELTSWLANQNKEFETQKQKLDEKRDLENKLKNENSQLKEQAKTQKQLLDERQTEIQKLIEQNQGLQKKLESTNVLPGNKQLHQEQKEKEDVNENKKLRIELITERLGNIKISKTNTILYIFAWMFQWASDTCKSYIEKAEYEKQLAPRFKQLKQNLETNGGNIANNDKQLIESILTTLDSFMPKYCGDGMCKKLANLYSELLNLHEHDINKVIKAFESVNNGKSYIELIKKNSVTKSREQNKSNDITNEVINLIK